MADDNGRASTWKQYGLVLLLVPMVLDSSFNFMARQGLADPAPREIVTLPKDLAALAIANARALESNGRLLTDIHSGIAPRDYNLIPRWSSLDASIRKLTAEIRALRVQVQKNTDANRGLSFEIEDRTHRAPPMSVKHTPSSEDKPPTVLRRIASWFGA